MLEEHWLLEKTKHLNSLTVAEIEMRRKKIAFVNFLILVLEEKFIWLRWIVKLANVY